MSYYAFLKEQSPDFQDETLGVELGEKMRSGELNEKGFRRLEMDELFRPMTIAEMVDKEDLALE